LLKKFIILLIVFFVPAIVHAADPLLEPPHWSLEFKGGTFAPALADWAQYYDKRSMPEIEGSLAYKLIRQVDIGISLGYAKDKGHALAPGHGVAAGNVTYEIVPVNLFILFRGVMDEDQWLVPYAGGGFTRLYYKETIEGQDTVNGSADGYHVRGGLQFLLNSLDERASNRMFQDYGVHHTYVFGEVEYTHAVVKSVSVNLGGTAYMFGFLFEF
jgi:hypothetical protein